MSPTLFRFTKDLDDRNLRHLARHNGPVFHRWLPAGENNVVYLSTADPEAQIKVWFEQRGFMNGIEIKYDSRRKEIDPSAIPTQGAINGGPISGQITLNGFSEQQLLRLKDLIMDDEEYIKLGKRVIQKILYPSVSRFIELLRINYGQYWIASLERWDSRNKSLSVYCSSWHLEWSLDGGINWDGFIPDSYAVSIEGEFGEYDQYITKQDWEEIFRVSMTTYEPSTAALVLATAHQYFDEGSIKHGLLEGVIALEIALDEYYRRKLKGEKELKKTMSAFWGLSDKAKMISLMSTMDNVPKNDLKNAISAIELRNKIVHEGIIPENNPKNRIMVRSLLNIIAFLMDGPKFKFPHANNGNIVMSIEEWGKRV